MYNQLLANMVNHMNSSTSISNPHQQHHHHHQQRNRGYPTTTTNNMAPGTGNERGQQHQQQPIGFANLTNRSNIWGGYNQPIGTRDSDSSPTVPSGSGALNANSQAESRWTSRTWESDNRSRSNSNSPNQTRDATLATSAGFFDTNPSIGLGGVNGYASNFPGQHRGSQDGLFVDPLMGIAPSRDQNRSTASRRSQGSPGFSELYSGGHPSGSAVSSHRPMPSQSSTFPNQAANNRSFQYNNGHKMDDVAFNLRQMSLDPEALSHGAPFNTVSQAPQMNSAAQAWANEAGSHRFNSSIDLSSDPLASQIAAGVLPAHLQATRRSSMERGSPAGPYSLEQSNSPRTFTPEANLWNQPTSSRNSSGRSAAAERRHPSSFNVPPYASYLADPYGLANFQQSFHQSYLEPFTQNLRNPMLATYGLPTVPYGVSAVPVRGPPPAQDPGRGLRSDKLEEYRRVHKFSKHTELRSIFGHVVEFSGDQYGSRFIQTKLETANGDEKDHVFREIEPNAVQLMKDVFGNYVIQKFFEHGNQVQKKILADKMKGKMVDLSIQVYACRVVQKGLEHVLVEQQAEMAKELEDKILLVMKDQNGNHVVQKMIELVPREHLDFILTATRGQVSTLASHAYACRVMQRLLEYGTEEDKEEIMAELNSSWSILITDQYGNYVAQHVIQNGKPEDRDEVIRLALKQLIMLSKHKFASNVIEKCIQYGTKEQRSKIRQAFTDRQSDGTSQLVQIMKDQYGNYVLQKLITELDKDESELLKDELRGPFAQLKKQGSSRQLLAMERLLESGRGTANTQGDSSSAAPTPVLTNETNSPQTNSPHSITASTVTTLAAGGKPSEHGVTPQVQDDSEA